MTTRTLFLVLLVPVAGLAQPRPTLTADEALAMARTRGPLAQSASATRQITEGRARTDAAWPNPVAEWRRENYGSALQPDIFATIQVPIDVTGRRLALRQAASAASHRGRSDSAAVMRQLDADVLRAFYRASLSRELATIADTERQSREQTAVFDAQRFAEGAVAEVVAMRARLEADRARVAAAAARAEADRGSADLARLLGTSATLLPTLAPLEAPAPTMFAPSDTAWAEVRIRRPDLAAQRLALEEADRRVTAESRGIVGDLNVVGGYKGTGGLATGVLGFMVPLPLFTRNEGPRLRARGEQSQARATLLDAEWRARGDVEAAARAWELSMQVGRAGAAALNERASEVASIAEAAYREGATSQMELLESQRARAEARATAARWAADAQLSRIELQRATGLPFRTTP